MPEGTVDCVLSYCHYTLCDDSLCDMIPYLQSKKVGIINASPLCMGLLTKRGPPSWHPAPPALQDAAKKAVEESDKCGVDIAEVALQFSLKNDSISTTLVGMCTVEQVEQNCLSVLRALNIEPQKEQKAFDQAQEAVVGILQSVNRTSWPSGLPENN